jgi:ElaB/YqjD/DUF883 family membrane-anchored ribosome-binding protein
MSSLQEIRSLTAVIKLQLTDEVSLTLRPLLERVSPKDKVWAKLEKAEQDAKTEGQRLLQELESVLQNVGQLAVPNSERLQAFRQTIADSLVSLGEQLDTENPDVIELRRGVVGALAELEKFTGEILPSEEERAAKESEARLRAEELSNQLLAVNAKLETIRNDKLAHLLDHADGWDLTDDDKPLKVTRANIEALPIAGLPQRMYDECIDKVQNFLAPRSTGSSSHG